LTTKDSGKDPGWDTPLKKLGGVTAREYLVKNAWSMTDLDITRELAAAGFRRSISSIKNHRQEGGFVKFHGEVIVKESPFVKYDSPPVIEADRVAILPDIQFPYHHAEFVNNVLALCKAWNVKHCVLAGDVIENSSLTQFDPAWDGDANPEGISDDLADELADVIAKLPKSAAQQVKAVIEKRGRKTLPNASGVSDEWHIARKELRKLVDCFDDLVWTIGNHEGRVLRQVQSPIFPEDLKRMFLGDEAKVRIAPYYYAIVKSGGVEWRVIHPKSSAKYDSRHYASKFLTNIAMAHSHQWVMQKDRSGKYWGIEIGAMVDERRLPYVSQRDAKHDAHLLGALIIRNGKPWLLGEDSDWEALVGMRV